MRCTASLQLGMQPQVTPASCFYGPKNNNLKSANDCPDSKSTVSFHKVYALMPIGRRKEDIEDIHSVAPLVMINADHILSAKNDRVKQLEACSALVLCRHG